MSELTEQVYEQAVKNRHYLHQHPEVSDKEFHTTKFITDYLKKLGYRIITPAGLNTGVIAEIGNGKPTVALRSDIDALPIQEQTGLDYASVNDGVMHACGHDFHMASLLGAAELLADEKLDGTIRLVFQPAEETHVGAQEVVDAGGADGIDAIIGFHEKPDLKAGEVGILPGGLMAAVDQFKVTFTGKGTHAAMPNLGNDPIIALTSTVNELQTVVSRNEDPQHTAVLSVTHIDGGNTWNVIPTTAYFEGTVRTFDHQSRETVKKHFYDIVNGEASAFDLQAKIDWIVGPDVVDNNPKLTSIVEDETNKFAKVVKPVPSNAGEDFAYFSQRIPSVFVFMGSEGKSDWHHPDLVLKDEALKTGINWYYYNAKRLLKELKNAK